MTLADPQYFEYDHLNLSESEEEVVEKLKKVGELIHGIWLKQVDRETGEAVFYPDDVSTSELLDSARKDESITDHYTVVKRDDTGKLYSVPYRQEYKEEIDEYVKLLREAADLSEDRDTADYLAGLAELHDNGDFHGALVHYLQNKQTKIEVLMGPIETYLDKYLSVKCAFQFNLRVLSPADDVEADSYLDIVQNANILRPQNSVGGQMGANNITVRVDYVIMFSGRQAGTRTSSTNLPMDKETVQEYGTKIIFYVNSLKRKYEDLLKPISDRLFVVPYDDEDALIRANLRLVALHEISEAIIIFDDTPQRLQDMFDAVRELNAFLMGIKSAKSHVLNGVFSPEDLKHILYVFLLYTVDVYMRRTDPSIAEYAKGAVVVWSYLDELDVVSFDQDGRVNIDMTKYSEAMDRLAVYVSEILESGTRTEAYELFTKFGDTSFLDKMVVKFTEQQ